MKSAKRQQARTISVHKFGGAALANAQAIESVVALLARTNGMRVIVTSALAGVTDVLLSVARAASTGDLAIAQADARLLHERHLRVIELIDASDAPLRQYIDASFAQTLLNCLLLSITNKHCRHE